MSIAGDSDLSYPLSPDLVTPPDPLASTKWAIMQARHRNFNLSNSLRNTGVGIYIDLPQICVVGSQSVGKSSLIESISGVSLPRDGGTCTRCPTECSISRSDEPWRCTVSLRRVVDSNGNPIPQETIPFGDPIHRKSEVEDRIRRAQLAILNPKTPHGNFLWDLLPPPTREISFSRNSISLDISGPEEVDLSFCDLPGIIASVRDGDDDSDIEDVKDLVRKYIKNPKALILLVCACETELENQGARKLVKEYDPEGRRTIGVLTKPDRIEQGDEGKWLRLITGNAEVLRNGWYCVKLPDGSELKEGISRNEARRREAVFFLRTQPWVSLHSDFRHRLTTVNLTERLSEALSEMIAEHLPELQKQFREMYEDTQEALSKLPKDVSLEDPNSEILDLIGKFKYAVNLSIAGTTDPNGLIQRIRTVHDRFKRNIRSLAPRFVPFPSRSGPKEVSHVESVAVTEAYTHMVPTPQNYSERAPSEISYFGNADPECVPADPECVPADTECVPADTEYVPADPYNEAVDVVEPAANDSPPIMPFLPEEDRDMGWKITYLDEIEARIRGSVSRELPRNMPFDLKRDIMLEHIKLWTPCATQMFTAVEGVLENHIRGLARGCFSQHKVLHSAVIGVLVARQKECTKKTSTSVRWLLDLEHMGVLTRNEHYYNDYRDKFLAVYKETRWRSSESSRLYSQIQNGKGHYLEQAIANLRNAGFQSLSKKDFLKLLPSDPADESLMVMAEVRAYWQVAFKRFIDNVCMAVDHDLVRDFGEGIDRVLRQGLGITSADSREKCLAYLAQSPEVERTRDQLTIRLEQLEEAQKAISELAM